jgi:SH3 domain protein
MKYLTLAILIIATYFAPNAMAQNPSEAPAEAAEVTVQAAEAEKPPEVATQRLATPLVRFVSDEFYVPLRETPCRRCKIVHRGIKTGTELKLLEIREGWGLVLTDKGVEGWMEQQHLVDSPVASMQLAKDQVRMKKLADRNSQLEEIMGDLRQQSKSLRGKLDSTEGREDNLVSELAAIKEVSSDAIALNKQNQLLVKQNHMLQGESDVLKANLNDLQKDKRNQSFLYGGLTVFLGAILVVLIPKLRGRKRFSEWQ